MKSLKLLTIAPALLVMSLTACAGAKMDADKAKERADAYDAAAVAEKYSKAEVTTKVDIKKNTGVFADGGVMYSAVVAPIKAQDGTKTYEGDQIAYLVYDADDMKLYDGLEGYTVTYYSYKSKGLKIELKVDAEDETLGIKQTSKGTQNSYVLDDGRMEKGDAKMTITVSGSSGGISMEGELQYTMSLTTKWTAK